MMSSSVLLPKVQVIPTLQNYKDRFFSCSLPLAMASSHFRGPDILTTSYQPGVSALKIIHDCLIRNGDDVALIEGDTGEEVTFSELLEASSRISGGLQQADVSPGDLVVLCCDKSIVAYSLVLGATFTGATVILAPPTHADSIDELTSGQVVKALFYDSVFSEPVSQSVSRMSPVPRLLGKAEHTDPVIQMLLKSTLQFRLYEVQDVEQHVPLVFFSSGTTGKPKGIEVSDSHVQISGILFNYIHESLLVASPLYWYSALCTLLGALYKKYPLVITNSNDARYRLQLIEKYKVESFFSSVANMIQYTNEPMFEDFDLSSVKKVVVGGEILLPSVARPFFSKVLKGRCSLIVIFGSTEAGITSALVVKDEETMNKYALGACGTLVNGVEIKILDEDGSPVPVGVMGRIWTKSMSTKGYWKRDDLNRNFLDDKGFYDTGDSGCFDSEGNLYLRGRTCDLISFRGVKMSPAVLEDILMSHPAIQDAVVVGTPHSSDGQLPTAYVVLRLQHPAVSEEDIRVYVDGFCLITDQVEDSMRLRGGVHFRDSLPRVSNGKVIRKFVR